MSPQQKTNRGESLDAAYLTEPALEGESVRTALDAALKHHHAGKIREAEAIYKNVLEVQPNNPEALHLLGFVMYRVGRKKAAADLIGKAVAVKPDYAEALNNLGNVLVDQGEYEEAIEAYQKAITLDPTFAQTHSNLGILLCGQDKLDEALAACKKAVALDPSLAGAHNNLGLVLQKQEKYAEAGAYFHKAIALEPNYAEAHANLGAVLRYQGRLDEAVACCRQAIACAPKLATAYLNLGVALKAQNKLDQAIAAYREAIALKPDSAEAHTNLGAALRKHGDLDGAITAQRQAIALKPDYAEPYVGLGRCLREAAKIDESIAAYRSAIVIDPRHETAHYGLATALVQRGDPGEALEVVDEALDCSPGNTRFLSIKPLVLNDLGERDSARFLVDFARFMRLMPFKTVAGFDSLTDFNAALARHVCSHPSLEFAPADQATRFGQHSRSLLVEPKGPIGVLEAMIQEEVENYMRILPKDPAHPFLAVQPRRWRLDVWAVIMERQGHQVAHIHPSGWLSGVYYVKLPDVVRAPDQGRAGWIEFGGPRSDFPCKVDPELRMLQPEEGLMVLFPSYFGHRTVPYETDEERISIAFDIIPDDRNGQRSAG